MQSPARRYRYGKHQRLSGSSQFSHVFDARAKKTAGPLTARAVPNGLAWSRLGFAVPRRVGNAPTRNLIKRRLREAFRMAQFDWQRGYDIVLSVNPHEVHSLAEYQRLLFKVMVEQEKMWSKRLARQQAASEQASPDDHPAGN